MGNVSDWKDMHGSQQNAEKEPTNKESHNLLVNRASKAFIMPRKHPKQREQAVANARKSNATDRECKFQ
jgi:hypothetical protein